MRGADGIGAASGQREPLTRGQRPGHHESDGHAAGNFFGSKHERNWQTYTWVPLKDTIGNLVSLDNSGAAKTFRVMTDNGNYNANFYILAAVYTPPPSVPLLAAINAAGNLPKSVISDATRLRLSSGI